MRDALGFLRAFQSLNRAYEYLGGAFALDPEGSKGDYRVTNIEQNGEPRLSIGRQFFEANGLKEGTFPGVVENNRIRFSCS